MTLEKIYWVTDCFLVHFHAEAGKAVKRDGVLERAELAAVLIVTSAFTIVEVLRIRCSPRLPMDKADLVQNFFR